MVLALPRRLKPPCIFIVIFVDVVGMRVTEDHSGIRDPVVANALRQLMSLPRDSNMAERLHTAALVTQFLQYSYGVNSFGLELIDRTCVYESIFLPIMDTFGIDELNLLPELVASMQNQQADLEKRTSQMFVAESWIKELEAEVKNYKDQVVTVERQLKAACDRNVKHQNKALDEEHRANKEKKFAANYLASYENIVEQNNIGATRLTAMM